MFFDRDPSRFAFSVRPSFFKTKPTMLKRNFWKLTLSLGVILWALTALLPLSDRPFADYATSKSEAKTAEFAALIQEARNLAATKQVTSVFVGLKKLANQRGIDLTQYFPQYPIESSLGNIEKRNTILLDHLLEKSKSDFKLGLDLKGGVGVTLEVDEKAADADSAYVREAKLKKAIEIIGDRINSFGVAEPLIRAVGTNRIEVQIPGINPTDNPEIIDNVKKPARLDFRLVHAESRPSTIKPTDVPAGYEVLSVDTDGSQGGKPETLYYVVKRVPEMSGKHVKRAGVTTNTYGQFEVSLQFDDIGAQDFGKLTTANVGRMLAVVLDGKLYSAPNINTAITGGNASISGKFTQREAEQLAGVLNNPLDLPLVVKEQYVVGPSLAQDAISSGLRSAVIGTTLVAAFMITFYTTGGVVAVITLAMNLLIIFGVMASMGASLTLPGLAGIVLTVGMAVDANILIFERMREELALGKSLRTANESGFWKAFTTIMDAHLVQLIICAIMIVYGTGPIRGFGVTLAIGVISTLLSVLITAHMVMDWLIGSGFLKKLTMRHMLKSINVDFIKYGKPAFIASWIVVLLGVGVIVYKGDRIYGIDFVGGDVVSIEFTTKIDASEIRKVAAANNLGEVTPTYVSSLGGGKEILRVETLSRKDGDKTENPLFSALVKAYPNAGLKNVGESHIGAAIGAEIKWNAIIAVALSMVAILIYIAFRFEFGFGVGAMFSSLHDILMTIGIFVLFGHHFSAPMVAAILAIAGYSINETVVVFDRIREELKENPTGSLKNVVNAAINKVFARTIMTSTTTFLAALSLFLFGGGVLRDISFTFLVGIVTSTFSAIFVSAQVFYWWHKGDRSHVDHAETKPVYEWDATSKASK